jgi:hypothetical protein
MQGKYYTTTVKPNIDILGNVEIAVGGVIFDWTAFEIPKGTAALQSISAIVAGLNGADVAGSRDMELYFAHSVNGAAPPTLGNTGSAVTGIIANQSRPYVIDKVSIDGSAQRSSVHFISYNVWSLSGKTGNDADNVNSLLSNDDNYSGTTPGYQTLWVAGLAETAAFDFGTAVALNQAGHQAISTTAVDLITNGTDPRLVFAVGDEVVSFVAADGSLPKQVGTVTAIADNVSLEVDAVAEAFNHTTEICNRNPIKFRLNFSY